MAPVLVLAMLRQIITNDCLRLTLVFVVPHHALVLGGGICDGVRNVYSSITKIGANC
jgi:hypothetical protein